jgi:hypothetical protein
VLVLFRWERRTQFDHVNEARERVHGRLHRGVQVGKPMPAQPQLRSSRWRGLKLPAAVMVEASAVMADRPPPWAAFLDGDSRLAAAAQLPGRHG